MADVGYGSPGFGKSLRSLADILRGLEREAGILLERTDQDSASRLGELLMRGLSGVGLTSLFASVGAPELARGFIRLIGLADGASLAALRREVERMAVEAGEGRARDDELQQGVARLRATMRRLDSVVEGMARVQGRCASRLTAQEQEVAEAKRLTVRRDDHITRLIRDTAGQRALLERLMRGGEGPAEQAGRELDETRRRLERVESHMSDLKRLQKSGTQDLIGTLEGIRDRISRLEVRAAEMTREARAKGGRLDAVARHVASVDNRLSTALGRHRENLVDPLGGRGEPAGATG